MIKLFLLLLLFFLSNCGKIGPLMTDEEYEARTIKQNK